jgi:transposase IS116/IS110/IS902 family protein
VVTAAGTTVTEVFGTDRDISRFPGRDHFAACGGIAPIKVSSGQREIYRL